MRDVILHADGAVTGMAPGYSAEAERMSLTAGGVDCRIVDEATLKDQVERITAARIEALARVRRLRDGRLDEMDRRHLSRVIAGTHPDFGDIAAFESAKQALRDLPATVTSRGDLDGKDADELDDYEPPELQENKS